MCTPSHICFTCCFAAHEQIENRITVSAARCVPNNKLACGSGVELLRTKMLAAAGRPYYKHKNCMRRWAALFDKKAQQVKPTPVFSPFVRVFHRPGRVLIRHFMTMTEEIPLYVIFLFVAY